MSLVRTLLAVTFIGFVLCGCTVGSLSGDVYSRNQARRLHTVEYGQVIAVRAVQIEGTKSGFGVISGGAIGAASGSGVGDGASRRVATAAGGVAGALAGAAVEEAVTRQTGLEITVDLDGGGVVVVAQGADIPFKVGDRVRVLWGGYGEARVQRGSVGP